MKKPSALAPAFIAMLAFFTCTPTLTALAQQTTSVPDCTVTATSSVTAYDSADTTAQPFPLSAGDGGLVAGESTDSQWIGFDPGIAQAGNLGLNRLKWVPAKADVTLTGNCSNLTMIDPPPTQGCYLAFGEDIQAFMQPDSSSATTATLGMNDYAMLVGQLSDGWYAWSNPGAQAGSTGTIQLKWIQGGDAVQLSGNCDALPTFYPVPKLSGDICTVLTGNDAKAYAQAASDAASTPLPGLLVQVLAKTPDQWYGYDPGDAQGGAVGVVRLRWIQASDADQINGDCADVPIISPAPTRLTSQENNTSITVNLGDTVEIMLPGASPDTGAAWDETGNRASDASVIQQQGQAQFDASSKSTPITLTYQAVGAGQTTLALQYNAGSTDATPSPDDSFTVTIMVQK